MAVAFARFNTKKNPKNKTKQTRDFRDGPVVKNLPSNSGDTGLIPGRGTKISHATGQLSPHGTTTELTRLNSQLESQHATNYRVHVLWSPCATTKEEKICMMQLQRSLCATTKDLACLSEDPVYHN